ERVRASTNEVGGRLLDMGGAEYMIRGLGYLRSLSDLETVPVATKNGTPVLIRNLGTITFGPDIREGVAEWQGEGETVAGIVVMRDGMNALDVINGVKKKLAEVKASLPAGVEVISGYDRSGLIHSSIKTLQRDLLEEAIIVSVVIIVENGYRQLSEHQSKESAGLQEAQRHKILLDAAKQVGPAIFFSLLIIVVSFLPVFLLEAQEGRMFRPLAWTKTLAVAFSSLLAITLVPVLMILFIRGKLGPEFQNPLS